jgi:hypothetical protein
MLDKIIFNNSNIKSNEKHIRSIGLYLFPTKLLSCYVNFFIYEIAHSNPRQIMSLKIEVKKKI